MSGDFKRIVSGSCWIIPLLFSWFLMVVFVLLIPFIGEYLLLLPVVFFILLFYASHQYGKWYSSSKDK